MAEALRGIVDKAAYGSQRNNRSVTTQLWEVWYANDKERFVDIEAKKESGVVKQTAHVISSRLLNPCVTGISVSECPDWNRISLYHYRERQSHDHKVKLVSKKYKWKVACF